VFASARREDVLASLAATTPNVSAIRLDVTDEHSVADAWEKIEARNDAGPGRATSCLPGCEC
jgi:NADP-dependent 3-hydroxy acid dehydrogenase YdfG